MSARLPALQRLADPVAAMPVVALSVNLRPVGPG